MISKRKAVIGAIFIFVFAIVLNMTVGNFLAVQLGQRVVITKKDYEYYRNLQEQYGKFFALKDFLEKNYYKELDEEALMEGAIKGMFDGVGDPYTVYMNEKEFSDLMTKTQGSYGGIGVIVTPGDDGYVTVVSPIEDTPGERAGLMTGDRIIAVNGEAISADKLDYAVELMKGKPGTDVQLSILRHGKFEPFDVKIKREEIRLKTVKSEVLDDHIGYIRISTFDEQTAKDFKEHLTALQKQNVDGLVLDLRNNPGGLLSQCVEIADVLLGEEVIVYTEDRHGNREVEKSDKKLVDLPLVILVNKGSASASEILAGAIKDNNRGTIIGTTTFGKGLVQQVKPLSDGTGFKFTISEYFTPSGVNIHGTGIEPDIVVELPENINDEEAIETGRDVQLQKAIEVVNKKIKK